MIRMVWNLKNPNHTGIIVRFWETAHLPLP